MSKNQHSMLQMKVRNAIKKLHANNVNTEDFNGCTLPDFREVFEDQSAWTSLISQALRRWIADAPPHLNMHQLDMHQLKTFLSERYVLLAQYDQKTLSAFGQPETWPTVDAQAEQLVDVLASGASNTNKLNALDALYDNWHSALGKALPIEMTKEENLVDKISIEGFADSAYSNNNTLSLIQDPQTLEHPKALKIIAQMTNDHGDIGLHNAVRCSHQITTALIQHGADINNVNGFGSVMHNYFKIALPKSPPKFLRALLIIRLI